MDPQEAENRLRIAFRTTEATSPGERENKLRQEIRVIFMQTPKAEQGVLLERLTRAFPVWPPDVPPPPPPTDQEMIDKLKMRCDSGEETRRRIEGMLRAAGLGGGLPAEAVALLRERVAIDPASEPEVGRVVEAFLVMLQTMADLDQAIRNFLHHHGLGMLAMQVPRFRDTAVRLLVLRDENHARHAEHAKLENSCSLLARIATLLVQWPEDLAGRLASKFAPSPIEAVAPKGMMGGVKFDHVWAEYQRRLNGARDVEAVKGEFLDLFKRIINETATQ